MYTLSLALVQKVGQVKTPAIPPDLFVFDPAQGGARIVTKLNSELDKVSRAPIDDIDWITSKGELVHGLLLKPVDYRAGTRYPLVIQTKGSNGSFLCDSGPNHDPSFIPQPIANAGMMYLLQTTPEAIRHNRQSISAASYPAPGGLGEVLHYMDVWDSAVKSLDRRGLIDPAKVGIIGFSRTGWQVKYYLAHAKTQYAAATASDDVQYSYGEYWLYDKEQGDEYDRMYGGPPYGTTLKNWLRYSVSFNFEKITTPLLMEQMGYGVRDDVPGSIPRGLAASLEVLVALKRLNVPVELYYYPDDVHQPEHPLARLASIERNLDWYRFWLQGFEDPNPMKKEQYARWRHLRELRDADAKATEQKQIISPKPR